MGDRRARLPFVVGVDVGVQEADRDRLDAFSLQRAARRLDVAELQLAVHLAGAEHSLIDLDGEMARHQRPVALEQQIVGFRPVAAADGVDVAGALGDDQRRLGALALDQRVDRDGRAVDQFVDGAGFESALADAIDDALDQMRRRRQALGLDEALGAVVEPDQIGECAANIDCNDDHAPSPCRIPSRKPRVVIRPKPDAASCLLCARTGHGPIQTLGRRLAEEALVKQWDLRLST